MLDVVVSKVAGRKASSTQWAAHKDTFVGSLAVVAL